MDEPPFLAAGASQPDADDSFASLDDTLLHDTPEAHVDTEPPDGPMRYGRESMYVELVQEMICVVLEHESHLFSERERDCLSQTFLLPYDARYLLVRLVQRKRDWHRIDRLAYDNDVRDLHAACTHLCRPFAAPGNDDELYRFAMMDAEMQGGLEARLALLTLDELKSLARRLGVPRHTTREALTAALLAKPKNATLLGLADAGRRELRVDFQATHRRLEEELERAMAGCIKLVPDVCALIDRVALVYYRGRPALGSLLTSGVLSRTRKCHFPSYRTRRTPDLFASRDALLQYEYALQLEETMDTQIEALGTPGAASDGVVVLDEAWPLWKAGLADLRKTFPHDIDQSTYVRMRFHPGWVLTRVLYKGCECLARLGQRERERSILRALISQRFFRRGRRGQWHDRLALLCAKADGRGAHEAKQDALACCVAALADPDTHLVYVFGLQRRIERLEGQLKIPRAERRTFVHNQLRQAKEVRITGVRLPPTTSTHGRSVWRSARNEPCTVEALCLEAYARRHFRGFHCEGNVVLFLFTLLMWDVLFMDVDGAFETAYQREPLDLPTDVFAVARHDAIAARLAVIEATGGLDLLRAADARERPLKTYAVACRWDDYSQSDLEEICECIGGHALALLCRLLCEEWAMRTSGFPDLCLWRYEDRAICFAEVKSPNDRLSEKQKVWIDVLLRAGIAVELALVDDEENPHSPPKRRRS